MGGHFGFSDRNDVNYLCSTGHPVASYQVLGQLAFWFRRRSKNRWRPFWIYDRNGFGCFLSSHPDASCQGSGQLVQRCKKLLMHIVDAALRTTDDARRTRDNGWRTSTDHNCSCELNIVDSLVPYYLRYPLPHFVQKSATYSFRMQTISGLYRQINFFLQLFSSFYNQSMEQPSR